MNADYPERKHLVKVMTLMNLERERETETGEKGQIQLNAFLKKWGGVAG